MATADVIVVGGGIAGLATAHELHKRGTSFVLLERSARPGGTIRTEDVDGFRLEAGPDALLIQKPEAIRLAEEIGLGDRLVSTNPPRLAFIQRGGRLYPLPEGSVLGIPTRIRPFIATRLFSWPGKIRMGLELFVPQRRDSADESIGSFMARRFGREAVAYLAEPLLAGIHAGDVDRLSLGALFPRFAEAERKYGSLMRAFRRQMRSPATAGASRANDGAFKSFPEGLELLVRTLVARLPRTALRFGAAAVGLGRDPEADGTWRVELEGETLAARVVILCAPAYAVASIVRRAAPNLAAACGEIPYVSSATVSYVFPRDAVRHSLNGSGYVVPRVEDRSILAASWMSSKWPGRVPPGYVLLRVFVGGARDPGALAHDDAALVARGLHAIRPVLGVTGEPALARVYRYDRANAQHEVGHLDRLARIDRALAGHPGLYVTGSGFRGTGIPDCIADARATVAQAARFLARSSESKRSANH